VRYLLSYQDTDGYIVQLLQTKRSDQNFKIIVTVRDYALDEVKKICQSVDYGEIPIDPFSGKASRSDFIDE
jgi:hypothetical protein